MNIRNPDEGNEYETSQIHINSSNDLIKDSTSQTDKSIELDISKNNKRKCFLSNFGKIKIILLLLIFIFFIVQIVLIFTLKKGNKTNEELIGNLKSIIPNNNESGLNSHKKNLKMSLNEKS